MFSQAPVSQLCTETNLETGLHVSSRDFATFIGTAAASQPDDCSGQGRFMISLSARWVRPWLTHRTEQLSSVYIYGAPGPAQENSTSIFSVLSQRNIKHVSSRWEMEGGVVMFLRWILTRTWKTKRHRGQKSGNSPVVKPPGLGLAWSGLVWVSPWGLDSEMMGWTRLNVDGRSLCCNFM